MVGEQHYTEVFQSLPMPCLILLPNAPHFTIVNVSDAYLAITNTRRESMVGKGFLKCSPPIHTKATTSGRIFSMR